MTAFNPIMTVYSPGNQIGLRNPFARPVVHVSRKETDGSEVLREYTALKDRLSGTRQGESVDATLQAATSIDARAKAETQLDNDPRTEDRISLDSSAKLGFGGRFRNALADAMGLEAPTVDAHVTFRERDGYVNKEVRVDLTAPSAVAEGHRETVRYALTVDDQGNVIDRK